MRTYTQLIEYWLRIATTAVITPLAWPERNSMRIVQQLELGYHQAGKSSHSLSTEDTSDLYSLMVAESVNLANLVRCTLKISAAQCTLVFTYC